MLAKLLLPLLLLLGTTAAVSAQFAAEFNFIVTGQATTGEYAVVGLFTNNEPVKSPVGRVYDVADIKTDSSHYFVDITGQTYYIVGKSGTTPLTLQLDRETEGEGPPVVGPAQLTSVNAKTNEFYISGPTPPSLVAKLQRINLIRRLIYQGGNLAELEGFIEQENATGGVVNIRNKQTDEIVKLEAGDGLKYSERGKNRFRLDNEMYTSVEADNMADAGRKGVNFGQYFIASQSNTMGATPGDYIRRKEMR